MSRSEFLGKLREYQRPHLVSMLKALTANRSVLDASDTGTGKTFVAVALAKALGIKPFVICPRSLKPTWERVGEFWEHPVEVVNYEKVRVIPGDTRSAIKEAKAAAKRFRDIRLTLGEDHPDALEAQRELNAVRREATQAAKEAPGTYGTLIPHGSGSYWRWHQDYALMIFDEVHNCTGTGTLNSKMLKAARRQSQYVIGLSATAAESPLHLDALGFALGLHDGKDFWKWLRGFHCFPAIFGGGMQFTADKEKQDDAMKRLNALLFPKRAARMQKSLIKDFPLTQVEAKLVGEEESIPVNEILESLTKAHKASDTAAQVKLMQDLELRLVPYAAELVKLYTATSSVAVFCSYTATTIALQAAIADAIDYWPGIVDGHQVGETGLAERTQMVQDFQDRKAPALILNSQAGNAGLSLHDPVTKKDVTTLIFPQYSGRVLGQLLGRANRDAGGFSQQFLLGFAKTLHETTLLTAVQKLTNLNTLNDGFFYGC